MQEFEPNEGVNSPFSELYKVKTSPADQNHRRKQLLEEQKNKRHSLQDLSRGIEEESTSETFTNPKQNNKPLKKVMLSEWFTEVPEDFDVSWVMKFCPVGKRNLVVATKGATRSYSRLNKFEYKFRSELPGGTQDSQSKTTILDCIWVEATQSFYILDLLVWAGYDVTYLDAEVRFFMLQSKVSETEGLEHASSKNKFIFKLLPNYPCDYTTIKNCLDHPYFENNLPPVDGILFYHKEASYTCGRTPLVGWLKPFMVPEILGILVAEEYMKRRPKLYVNLEGHIAYGKDMKKRRKKADVEMEEIVDVAEEMRNLEKEVVDIMRNLEEEIME